MQRGVKRYTEKSFSRRPVLSGCRGHRTLSPAGQRRKHVIAMYCGHSDYLVVALCLQSPSSHLVTCTRHLVCMEMCHPSATVYDGETRVQRRLLEDLRPLSWWTACRNLSSAWRSTRGQTCVHQTTAEQAAPVQMLPHSASPCRVHPGLLWKVKHLFHCGRV